MCNHCEIHRTRAAQERALAEQTTGGVRLAHLELAELHEKRIEEYRRVHGPAVKVVNLV